MIWTLLVRQRDGSRWEMTTGSEDVAQSTADRLRNALCVVTVTSKPDEGKTRVYARSSQGIR